MTPATAGPAGNSRAASRFPPSATPGEGYQEGDGMTHGGDLTGRV